MGRLRRMESAESDDGYLKISTVFSWGPMELLEKRI